MNRVFLSSLATTLGGLGQGEDPSACILPTASDLNKIIKVN